GGLKDAPGVTDLVALPLLRGFSNLLLLLVPLVTMRTIAGERRAATLPLLLAGGLGEARIVFGKFLGAYGYVLVLVALVAAMPLALASGAALDFGKLAAALLGLALFAAALTAIGVFTSTFASHPALAAAAAIAINALLAMVDAGARAQGVPRGRIRYRALPTHAGPFFQGIVASVDIIHFLLLAAVALALATRRLGALRGAPD